MSRIGWICGGLVPVILGIIIVAWQNGFLGAETDLAVYPPDHVSMMTSLLKGYADWYYHYDELDNYVGQLHKSDALPMKGKNVLITGATNGLGQALAAHFAALGANLILPCRRVPANFTYIIDLGSEIRKQYHGTPLKLTEFGTIKGLKFDLADFDSIEASVDQIKAEFGPKSIDILVNNAGLQSPFMELTKQGFEKTFAVNYIGVAHFTMLLISNDLLNTKGPVKPKLLSVSSEEHREGERLNATKEPFGVPWGTGLLDTLTRYSYSKLAMTTFFLHLGEIHPEFTVYDICPGPVASNIAQGLGFVTDLVKRFMSYTFPSAKTAAMPLIRLLTAKEYDNVSPEHYHISQVAPARSDARDPEMQRSIYAQTMTMLKARKPPST